MARTVTLTLLTSRAQQRAGMEGSSFISSAEWTDMINESIADVWDQLEGAEMAPISTETFTADGVALTHSLPSDFYVLRAVLVLDSSGRELYELSQFQDHERAEVAQSGDGAIPRWCLNGTKLEFRPVPNANLSIQVRYVPAATKLVSGSDTFDGIDGWEEWVVLDVAAKALTKEESDVSAIVAARGRIELRIQQMAAKRQSAQPDRVIDVTRRLGYTPIDTFRRWEG